MVIPYAWLCRMFGKNIAIASGIVNSCAHNIECCKLSFYPIKQGYIPHDQQLKDGGQWGRVLFLAK